MDTTRRPTDDLLDVVRALLLLQGSIFVVTTIEALVFGAAFGAPGVSVVLTAVAAIATLIARVRVRADRQRTRRLIYVVEGLILATLALDTVLALLITHGSPPAVAVLTRFAMPVSVIALLRRSARASAAPLPSVMVTMEGV